MHFEKGEVEVVFQHGDALYRQELYFKNCKPAMIQSRKRESKIHDEGKAVIRKVKQFAADAFKPVAGVSSAYSFAA